MNFCSTEKSHSSLLRENIHFSRPLGRLVAQEENLQNVHCT